MNTNPSLLLGITLHGASFVLVFITAQIYLNQRIDAAWRTRAQALLTLLNGGVGNLIGYLGSGWWFDACTTTPATDWPLFWWGLTAMVAGVLGYFLWAFRDPADTVAAVERPKPENRISRNDSEDFQRNNAKQRRKDF